MDRTHGSMNSNPFEDPKIRLRHHSLMQDYRELHMETEAMRRKLQTVRERKATLMAEVRFLRRRYRHLREEQPQDDIKKVKGRSSNGEKKSKMQSTVEVSLNKRSDAEAKHVSLPDLNHSGKVQNETETNPKRRVPLFDLNQISGEEEEEEEEEEEATKAVNNNQENTIAEENSSCKRLSNSIEIQQNEITLSSCRNEGNGSHKRKISWQDPFAALRV